MVCIPTYTVTPKVQAWLEGGCKYKADLQLLCLKSRIKGCFSLWKPSPSLNQFTWEKNQALLAAMGLQIYFLPFNNFPLNTLVCHQ